MQIRVVRLNSRNPLVGIVLLVAILAILALVLTAGMALLAGGAVLGAVGYVARRVLGGKSLGAMRTEGERMVVMGEEVLTPVHAPDAQRLSRVPEATDARVEPGK